MEGVGLGLTGVTNADHGRIITNGATDMGNISSAGYSVREAYTDNGLVFKRVRSDNSALSSYPESMNCVPMGNGYVTNSGSSGSGTGLNVVEGTSTAESGFQR